MRVVLTVNYSPWSPYVGGGQRSTHSLATALARRGNAVTVVYTRALLERFEAPADTAYAVRWAGFFAARSRMDARLRSLNALTVMKAVASILVREGADAVHGNGEEAALLPALRRIARARGRRPPTIVLTPRYPRYPARMLAPARLGPADIAKLAATDGRYLLLGTAARGADFCCPTSSSAARNVSRAFSIPIERLRIIPNGVHPAFLEQKRSVPAPGAPLLFYGRLHPSKGADTLLSALALMGDVAPRLDIVGRGEAERDLRRMAREAGIEDRVAFHPWKEPAELAAMLARSSLAVLPSRAESFGNTMAEAMAVGVPVISTTAGSVPEVIEHERTGWLVEPGDAPALAGAIRMLLGSPELAGSLGRAGRERVQERFTWDAVAAAYERVYEGR